MSGLPVISGDQMVKALRRVGYEATRRRGSHVRMRHPTDPVRRPTTVPTHKELKPSTLRAILADANLSVAELRDLL